MSSGELVECPHAPACPGCALIGLPPAAQLAAKTARVAAAFDAYPALAGVARDPVRAAAATTDYRTRAKLAVGPGGRLGLFAAGTHEVLDLPGCRVLAPALAAAASALRGLLAEPPAGAERLLRAEGDGAGRLRGVDLREVVDRAGAAGVLLTLVVRAPRPARAALAAVCDALEAAVPQLRAVALSLHAGRSPQLLGGPPALLRGAAWHPDVVRAGAPYALAAPGGFAQAHRGQAARIHAQVEGWLAPLAGRRVLDAFAGNGALGLALAAAGAHVTAIEAFAPAGEAMARAAREQGLTERVRVHAETAETALPRLAAADARFDAAVVNPPRRGLAPRAREALEALCAGPLAYVSCEPATLARDLAHLATLGWCADRVAPFDLMPLTAEVECAALLRRGAPPPVAVLFEDDELVAVDKPPFLPTVPHPERAGSLLQRVRARPGCAGAVALHRLDAETSGAVLFARCAERAAAWQRALGSLSATKRYRALVRGVAWEKGRIGWALRERGRLLAASTRYRRLEVVGGHALLEVRPETGRTHQIRRHLSAIGEPVLGDARYGHEGSNRHLFARHFLDRPFLHCAEIELDDPRHLGRIRVESPLAPDLAAVLARLRIAGDVRA